MLMGAENNIQIELNRIRNQIIDLGLIIASFLSSITYVLSLLKFPEIGFQLSFVSDLIVVFIVISITSIQKETKSSHKNIFRSHCAIYGLYSGFIRIWTVIGK